MGFTDHQYVLVCSYRSIPYEHKPVSATFCHLRISYSVVMTTPITIGQCLLPHLLPALRSCNNDASEVMAQKFGYGKDKDHISIPIIIYLIKTYRHWYLGQISAHTVLHDTPQVEAVIWFFRNSLPSSSLWLIVDCDSISGGARSRPATTDCSSISAIRLW